MMNGGRWTDVPEGIARYYREVAEKDRLAGGPGRREFLRTKETVLRCLPSPPATVIDVGGAAGVYALPLAAEGYAVHLVDASPRLVEEARRRSAAASLPLASCQVADARRGVRGRHLALRVRAGRPGAGLVRRSRSAGFECRSVAGLEGPGWLFPDFDARWADPRKHDDLLRIARALEPEPSAVGMSAHMLAVAVRE